MCYTQNKKIDSKQKEEVKIKYKSIDIPYIEKKEGFRRYRDLVFDIYLKGSVLNQTSCTFIKKEVFR